MSHGIIEMFFFSTFADLIEFPLILDSKTNKNKKEKKHRRH
jgi:hypothetical protein